MYMEIVELILSGDLGAYFYINSLMAILLIAFIMAPTSKFLKLCSGVVVCFQIFVSYTLANHFLCLERSGEIFETVAILALLFWCGGFVLLLLGCMLKQIYIHLKLQ